jgi:hypothetical protein
MPDRRRLLTGILGASRAIVFKRADSEAADQVVDEFLRKLAPFTDIKGIGQVFVLGDQASVPSGNELIRMGELALKRARYTPGHRHRITLQGKDAPGSTESPDPTG